MRVLYGSMSSEYNRSIIATLRLMRAIVASSPITAKEFALSFDFSFKASFQPLFVILLIVNNEFVTHYA